MDDVQGHYNFSEFWGVHCTIVHRHRQRQLRRDPTWPRLIDFLGLHKICSRSGCDAWLPNLEVGSQRFEGGRIKNTFGIRKFRCKTGETQLMRQLEAKHKSNCLSQKTKQRVWISKIKANGKFFLDHRSLTATSAFSLLGGRGLVWVDF